MIEDINSVAVRFPLCQRRMEFADFLSAETPPGHCIAASPLPEEGMLSAVKLFPNTYRVVTNKPKYLF